MMQLKPGAECAIEIICSKIKANSQERLEAEIKSRYPQNAINIRCNVARKSAKHEPSFFFVFDMVGPIEFDISDIEAAVRASGVSKSETNIKVGIDVITNEYAIGNCSAKYGVLNTQYITTCTAFMGLDAKNGTVFLCHLNTPFSAFAIPDLVTKLRTISPNQDLSNFKLYTLGGIHPAYAWLFSVLLGILVWAGSHAPIFTGVFVFGPFIFFPTRLSLNYQLWKSKAFSDTPISLGYSKKRLGWGRTKVVVDSTRAAEVPKVESYTSEQKDKAFEPWTCKWTKMREAKKSALQLNGDSNRDPNNSPIAD